MKNIAVILARADSKRIPDKNMRLFIGKPVIQYSLEAAKDSGLFDKIIVSTDSDSIGGFATRLGAVYFKRGPEYATASAPMVDALIEVLDAEEKQWDNVCMIYACAPFIKIGTIKRAYEKLKDFEVAFPIFRDGNHAERSMLIREGHLLSRHPEYELTNSNQWPDTYQSAGQFYWARITDLMINRTLYPHSKTGIVIPESETVDIDTPEDWERAELLYYALNYRSEIEWTRKNNRLIKLCDTLEKIGSGDMRIVFRDGRLVDVKASSQQEIDA